MASKYTPLDRRDLSEKMTASGVALFFALLVQLKLCRFETVDQYAINDFSKRLYKLVQRRHSKIWTTNTASGKTP